MKRSGTLGWVPMIVALGCNAKLIADSEKSNPTSHMDAGTTDASLPEPGNGGSAGVGGTRSMSGGSGGIRGPGGAGGGTGGYKVSAGGRGGASGMDAGDGAPP